jgi:hypothetical protein
LKPCKPKKKSDLTWDPAKDIQPYRKLTEYALTRTITENLENSKLIYLQIELNTNRTRF